MEIDKNMTSVCFIDYLKILNSTVMFGSKENNIRITDY